MDCLMEVKIIEIIYVNWSEVAQSIRWNKSRSHNQEISKSDS